MGRSGWATVCTTQGEGQHERCTACSWAQLKGRCKKKGGARRWVVRVIMPSGSRDQWNLIRVESWAASTLAKLSDFPRWSGLLCEHRGIAEYHLRSQEAQDAYISHFVSSRFDLLTFLILLPPRFPPASMIETKAKSQNYLANPYNSLGPLPFDTDEYVLSVLRFRDLFFSVSISFRLHACPVTCQTATSEVSFDGQKTPLRHCPPRVGSSSRYD